MLKKKGKNVFMLVVVRVGIFALYLVGDHRRLGVTNLTWVFSWR